MSQVIFLNMTLTNFLQLYSEFILLSIIFKNLSVTFSPQSYKKKSNEHVNADARDNG